MSGLGARERSGGLDLLRATAAALVFATHLYHVFGMPWLGPIASGGWLGVYIFFPLSGYLLYRPFVEGTVDLRLYATSRLARIAPAYYFALAGLAAIGLVPAIAADPIAALTMTGNTFSLSALESTKFGQSWTIGVEVLFYALLPAVAFLVRQRPWLLIAGIAASWLSDAAVPLVTTDPFAHWWTRQLPPLFWAFGIGMLVARYGERLPTVFRQRAWAPGLALVAAALLTLTPLRADGLMAVGAGLLIVAVVTIRPKMRFARWPADLSYSVYLWHVGVTTALANTGMAGLQLLAIAVPATLGVAWLSFRYVERPVLGWAQGRGIPSGLHGPRSIGAEIYADS